MTALIESTTGHELARPTTEPEVARQLADIAIGVGQRAEKVLANSAHTTTHELVPGHELVRHDQVPVDLAVGDQPYWAEQRSVLAKRHYPDTGEDSVIAANQLVSNSARQEWRRDTFPQVTSRVNFVHDQDRNVSKVAFEKISQRDSAGAPNTTEKQRVVVENGKLTGTTESFDAFGRVKESMPLHWQKAEEVARHIIGLVTGEISDQERADDQHRYAKSKEA